MNFVAKRVIKHKILVVALFIAAAILCSVLSLAVSVNYNLVDYLPQNAQSTTALAVMNEEFLQPVPNGSVMIPDVTLSQAMDYKDKLASVSGVTEVLWLDDVIDITKPLEMADASTVEAYYKDGAALYSVTVSDGNETATLNEIYALIGQSGAVSGDFADTATAQGMAVSEATRAMIILVPVIIVIFLLTTSSWIEPILFLLAIGISVLLNMGTNLIFGNISFITQAISPILQMAVSLDYAIFLLHSFEDYRKQTADVHEAMRLAMKRSFSAIAASAATTLFGFVALVFMKFQIGSDLGLSLVKGIILSFTSVMVFLPAVTLCSYKLLDKTKHKKIIPEMKNIGKGIVKLHIPAIIIAALLIVPCFLAQSKNSFIYGTGGNLASESRSGEDTKKIEDTFGTSNAIVLLVPRGDPGREELLCSELSDTEHVTSVIAYVTAVGTAIPAEYLTNEVTSRFYSDDYARIILYTDTEKEGDAAFAVVEAVQSTAEKYYGGEVLSCGSSVNLYDMKNVVERDTAIVNLIAICAIAAVLLVTFKSVSLPLLLLLTIEASIWINLSVPYFSGNPLCYIGYLVISTVQLGATVDYAILLTDHYMLNRKTLPPKKALKETLDETVKSILISGSILASAGFCLGIISSNQIISELGTLLGRGAVLSVIMVILFLPGMLLLTDRIIPYTTLKAKLFNGGDENEEK